MNNTVPAPGTHHSIIPSSISNQHNHRIPNPNCTTYSSMNEQSTQPEQTRSTSPHSLHPQPPPPPPSPSLPVPPTGDSSSNSDHPQIATTNPSKIPIRPQKIRKLSPLAPVDSTNEEIKPRATKSIVISTKNRRRNPSQSAKDLPKVIKPLSASGEIAVALRHLRSVDPLIANLIDNHPPPTFDTHQAPFLDLSKSILYQQLAYKAGTSIYTRFVSLCGGENGVVPETVLSLTSQQLKQIGVSGRKASYLYDLANKYKNCILSDETIVKMDDRSLFTMLSMVKGIGSWSVHMFMIFSLHRPDVLPVSDLGVRKGVQLLYSLDDLPRPSQVEQICAKWRPFRSVGAWYMWRFVEGKGAPVAGAPAAALESGDFPGQLQMGQSEQAQQQQHQLQLLEPITNIGNLGACIWGQ